MSAKNLRRYKEAIRKIIKLKGFHLYYMKKEKEEHTPQCL